MRLNLCLSFFALALVASCTATASASDLVVNGNFQTGDFTGWQHNTSGVTNHPWIVQENGSNFYASTGCVGIECIEGNSTQEAWLSQVLATVAGETYTLTFDYSQVEPNAEGGTPNELVVDFGSDQVADLVNLTNTNIITYSYTVTATTSATELQFLGRQDPSYDYLDNVSVTQQSTVTPEPESLALFGTGIFALLGVARRKLQA
jgi:PEP-CTERM motif